MNKCRTLDVAEQIDGLDGLKNGMHGLYVTGTDTGVGKTAVATSIVRQLVRAALRVGVYKPVASGWKPDDLDGDAVRLWTAAGRPLRLEAVCPQAFVAPISPPRSARAEGRTVDEQLLRTGFHAWREASDVVIVEGAGALFSPLGDATLNADLAHDLDLPLVVVDTGRLGAIGRTLAVVRAARAEGLRVAAVVMSHVEPLHHDPSGDDPASPGAIAGATAVDVAARISPVPLAVLRHGASEIEPSIDWAELSRG
jgi:dethiobiotin synthetase